MIKSEIIADSISHEGVRITSLSLMFPRFILAEFNTHRMLSRNSASSRAIPTKRIIDEIRTNPAMPVSWNQNVKGMQGGDAIAWPDACYLEGLWFLARDNAVHYAEEMAERGLAKQTVNRVLEPFMHSRTLVTATDWDNFFNLRLHPDAQPEFKALAEAMKASMDASEPTFLGEGQWHKPYADKDEHLYRSVARAARVSYKTHENKTTTDEADRNLAARLLQSGHMSPFEHQATPCSTKSNNFTCWKQLREVISNDNDDERVESWFGRAC